MSKRHERRDFSESLFLDVELSQLVVEMILEQDVVDASVLRHRIEVELRNRREPVFLDLLQSRGTGWESFDGEESKETAAINNISFDYAAHLACGNFPVRET